MHRKAETGVIDETRLGTFKTNPGLKTQCLGWIATFELTSIITICVNYIFYLMLSVLLYKYYLSVYANEQIKYLKQLKYCFPVRNE